MKFLVSVLALGATLSAFSQSGEKKSKPSDSTRVYAVPSVTVTSSRAVLKESPVTFSEISRAELKQTMPTLDLPVHLSALPSMLFYSDNGSGIGYSTLSLRGFDQRRIAVTINGIPQNDPEDHSVYWIDFPDIGSNLDNVQVQRGAGLASSGAAAIGGSVNLQTSNFANERTIKVSSGIGFQEFGASGSSVFQASQSKYSLELSSGMVANYAFYGRVSRIFARGYRDNSWAELNSFFLSGVRYDENITTQINAFGGPIADGLAYMGLPKSFIGDKNLRRKNYSYWEYGSVGKAQYETARKPQEIENFSQPHFEILNDIFLNENLTLKSSLFYYLGDGFFDFDGSWASADNLRLTPQYGFPAGIALDGTIIRAVVSNKHGGWIPRLEWKHADGILTLGGEARIHRSEHWGKIQYAGGLPNGYNPDYKVYSYDGKRDIFSLFARENRVLSQFFSLNAEMQIISHSYRIGNEKAGNLPVYYTNMQGESVGGEGDLFSVNHLFFNPRIGITYKADAQTALYSSIAFTSREPRMDNYYRVGETYYSGATPLFASDTSGGKQRFDFSQPLAKAEKLLDIELGSHTTFSDGKISANIFWMEFFDELVKNGKKDIFGAPIDGNAPKTRHVGVEIEAGYTVFRRANASLSLSANASYSQNRIVEYMYQHDDGTVTSLAGKPIAGFPDFLANLVISYEHSGFSCSLAEKYVGQFYTDLFANQANQNDAYSVLNLHLGYTISGEIVGFRSMNLRAIVNNLANSLYSASGNGAEFFPAAERNYYFGLELGL